MYWFIKKENIKKYEEELDRYYNDLKTILAGEAVNAQTAFDHFGAHDKDEVTEKITRVNGAELRRKLKLFKATVEVLTDLVEFDENPKKKR